MFSDETFLKIEFHLKNINFQYKSIDKDHYSITIDGDTYIYSKNTNLLHNTNGPSIKYSGGLKFYNLDGNSYSYEKWKEARKIYIIKDIIE